MNIFFILTLTLSNLNLFLNEIQTIKDDWKCPKEDAIKAFKLKVLINQYPNFKNDPYKNQTSDSLIEINKTLANLVLVCAIQYTDSSKINYVIKNFPNKTNALENSYIVTHQGRCGACSNLNDLSTYLSKNLTVPTRKCGMLGAISESLVILINFKSSFSLY
jgi:hypothetical protein